MEVLKLAPQEYVDNFYGDVKAEIKKLDKDDKSGLKAADALSDQLKKERKDVQNYLAGKLTDKTGNTAGVADDGVRDLPEFHR